MKSADVEPLTLPQAADWLTEDMLDEQHRGARELAGRISELRRMTAQQPNMGEYLFDLQLAE